MSLLILVRRHLRTAAGAGVALAVVALLAAGVASARPRAVGSMHAEQLAHAVGQTSAISRDVVATSPTFPGYGGAYEEYHGLNLDGGGRDEIEPPQPDLDGFLDAMGALAARQPAPLVDVLGEPDLYVESDRLATALVEGNDVADPGVVLRAAPRADEHVEVVEGRMPEPTPVLVDRASLLPGPDGVVEVEAVPVEVAMSVESAEQLGWTVGSVHDTADPVMPQIELVGLWEATDPGDDYWAHGPLAVSPQVIVDPNTGLVVTAAVLADPGTLAGWVDGPQARLWYEVDATGVSAQDAAPLLAQLRGFTAATSSVVEADPAVLEPATGLLDVLEQTLGQRLGVDAIVAVLAVGPFGAAAAVLALAARLLVERRREALALLTARGASGVWVRAVVGLEGLVLGLPAAAAGLGLGLLVVPGAPSAGQVLTAAACGLAPAAALAASVSRRGLRARRSDLGAVPVRRARARLWAEIVLACAAAGTAWLAIDRGVVAGSATSTGRVDPLLVVAPLLVSLTAVVVTVRLVPPVVRVAERLLARRRDLVAFLGAARVRRDPAGGLVPALALVLAVGVAASSSVLAATVREGIAHEAWGQVGAEVRVAGPVVDDETLGDVAAIEGVEAAATITDAGRYGLADGTAVTLYVTQAPELAVVQADVPGAPTDLERLSEAADGRLPVVAAGTAASGSPSLAVPGGAVELDVVSTVDRLPGLPPTAGALLVDAGRAAELLGVEDGAPRLALLSLVDGSDAERAAVEAGLTDLLPTAVVDDPTAGERELLATPSAAGLQQAFGLAVALSVVLCVAAVLLMLVLAGPARARLLAVLRTLGMPRGAERGLVAWEVGPWAAAALVTGGVLGWAVPALVVAVVDLSPLTGGAAQPALAVDPWWSAALVLGLVVVVTAACVVAGALGRRGDLQRVRAGTD